MEVLAHPLRQEILIFIEQEGETGYRDLKNKFNVATGTLYHHLRILKGLVIQNSAKKYILTDEGVQALDFIFQDKKTTEHKPIKEIQEEVVEQPETIVPSKEVALKEQIESFSPQSPTLQNFKFFNINSYIKSIPDWFFKTNGLLFVLLPLLLLLENPKVVFFHFIPIEIHEIWLIGATIVFPIFNLIVLSFISIIKKENISLSTIGLLLIYYNIVFCLTIVSNLFPITANDLLIHLLSIVIQGLFIFFWTLSISLQYYSWEKSLFLAIVQNYLLLLLF